MLAIDANSMKKYTNTVLKTLFTKSELQNGYIIEGTSSSQKEALDLERINLLKEAIRLKYKIPELTWQKTWKELKIRANRVCSDAKKKKDAELQKKEERRKLIEQIQQQQLHQ